MSEARAKPMTMRMTWAQRAAIKQKAEIADLDADKLIESAQPTIGCDGAVAVFWCGMWLCVETDGHVHS